MDKSHSDFHSKKAFCGSAGPEEMCHIHELLEELSEKELKNLVNKVGIKFRVEDEDLLERDDYLGVIDEAEREKFYKEYKKIISLRKKVSNLSSY
jgi:hypothetical protein